MSYHLTGGPIALRAAERIFVPNSAPSAWYKLSGTVLKVRSVALSMDEIPETGWHVYTAFDSDGNALYVGMSNHLRERLKAHRNSSPWYHDAKKFVWIPLWDKKQTRAAEIATIQELSNPRMHNVEYNPLYKQVRIKGQRFRWVRRED